MPSRQINIGLDRFEKEGCREKAKCSPYWRVNILKPEVNIFMKMFTLEKCSPRVNILDLEVNILDLEGEHFEFGG